MVFEKQVSSLIEKHAGAYLEGVDAKSLSMNVAGGNIQLHDLAIKKSALDGMNLPYALKYGKVGSLKIQIPWRKLRSEAVRVQLQNVHLILDATPEFVRKAKVTPFPSAAELREMHEHAIDALKKKLASQEKAPKPDGFVQRLITRIIDNIQIDVESVHIRVEDGHPKTAICSGITLSRMRIVSTDANGDEMFVHGTQRLHKKLEISGFGVYFNPGVPKLNERAAPALLRDTVVSNAHDATPITKYLIQPISLTAWLGLNKSGKPEGNIPKMSISANIQAIGLRVERTQLVGIVGILDRVNLRRQQLYYKRHRPLQSSEQHFNDCWNQEISPAQMWRFAVKCVQEEIKAAKRWDWKHLIATVKHAAQYKQVCMAEKVQNGRLSKSQEQTQHELEMNLSIELIELCRKSAGFGGSSSFQKPAASHSSKTESPTQNPVKRSWWFGKKKKIDSGTNGDNNSSNAGVLGGVVSGLSEDQEDGLLDMLEFSESEVGSDISQSHGEDMKLNISLASVSVSLIHKKKRNMTGGLADLILQRVETAMSMSGSSLTASVSLDDLIVHDSMTAGAAYPNIICKMPINPSNQLKEAEEPLLKVQYASKPKDKECDLAIKAKALPLKAVVNMPWVAAVSAFAVIPSSHTTQAASAAVSDKAAAAKISAGRAASKALESRPAVDLDLTVSAPIIFVPQHLISDAPGDSPVLVISLGQLKLGTTIVPRKIRDKLSSNLAEQENALMKAFVDISSRNEKADSALAEDVLVKLPEASRNSVYDRLDIKLTGLSALMTSRVSNWQNGELANDQGWYLLKPVSFQAAVQLSLFPSSTSIPSTRVGAILETLQVDFSAVKYSSIMGIMSSMFGPAKKSPASATSSAASLSDGLVHEASGSLIQGKSNQSSHSQKEVISEDEETDFEKETFSELRASRMSLRSSVRKPSDSINSRTSIAPSLPPSRRNSVSNCVTMQVGIAIRGIGLDIFADPKSTVTGNFSRVSSKFGDKGIGGVDCVPERSLANFRLRNLTADIEQRVSGKLDVDLSLESFVVVDARKHSAVASPFKTLVALEERGTNGNATSALLKRRDHLPLRLQYTKFSSGEMSINLQLEGLTVQAVGDPLAAIAAVFVSNSSKSKAESTQEVRKPQAFVDGNHASTHSIVEPTEKDSGGDSAPQSSILHANIFVIQPKICLIVDPFDKLSQTAELTFDVMTRYRASSTIANGRIGVGQLCVEMKDPRNKKRQSHHILNPLDITVDLTSWAEEKHSRYKVAIRKVVGQLEFQDLKTVAAAYLKVTKSFTELLNSNNEENGDVDDSSSVDSESFEEDEPAACNEHPKVTFGTNEQTPTPQTAFPVVDEKFDRKQPSDAGDEQRARPSATMNAFVIFEGLDLSVINNSSHFNAKFAQFVLGSTEITLIGKSENGEALPQSQLSATARICLYMMNPVALAMEPIIEPWSLQFDALMDFSQMVIQSSDILNVNLAASHLRNLLVTSRAWGSELSQLKQAIEQGTEQAQQKSGNVAVGGNGHAPFMLMNRTTFPLQVWIQNPNKALQVGSQPPPDMWHVNHAQDLLLSTTDMNGSEKFFFSVLGSVAVSWVWATQPGSTNTHADTSDGRHIVLQTVTSQVNGCRKVLVSSGHCLVNQSPEVYCAKVASSGSDWLTVPTGTTWLPPSNPIRDLVILTDMQLEKAGKSGTELPRSTNNSKLSFASGMFATSCFVPRYFESMIEEKPLGNQSEGVAATVLSGGVTFKNLLNIPLGVYAGNANLGTSAKERIPAGEKRTINTLSQLDAFSLTINLEGSSAHSKMLEIKKQKHRWHIDVGLETTLFRLVMERVVEKGFTFFIIYAPYWIVNRSGLTLEFGVQTAALGSKISQNSLMQFSQANLETTVLDTDLSEVLEEGVKGQPWGFANKDGGNGGDMLVRIPGGSWSRKFGVDNIGGGGEIVLKDNDKNEVALAVATSLASGPFWRTKVVTISPRHIVVNQTTVHLRVRSGTQSTSRDVCLAPGERKAICFPNGSYAASGKQSSASSRAISFLPEDRTGTRTSWSGMSWSGWLLVDSADVNVFKVMKSKSQWHGNEHGSLNEYDGLNIPETSNPLKLVATSSTSGNTIIMKIEECLESTAAYAVFNHSSVHLFAVQDGCQEIDGDHIRAGEKLSAGWISPVGSKKIKFFTPPPSSRSCVVDVESIGNSYTLNSSQKLSIFVDAQDGIRTFHVHDWDARKRTKHKLSRALSLINKNAQEVEAEDNESELSQAKIESKIELKFAGLGISIVDTHPREILYAAVLGLQFTMERTALLDTTSFTIRRFQIDDQISSENSVLIGHASLPPSQDTAADPSALLKLAEADGSENTGNSWAVTICKARKEQGLDVIPSIFVNIPPICISVKETFVTALLGQVTELVDALSPEEATQSIDNDESSVKAYLPLHTKFINIDEASRDSSGRVMYVKSLVINVIHVRISLYLSTEPLQIPSGPSGALLALPFAILSAVKSVAGNLENSPITFDQLTTLNAFATKNQLVSRIVSHYATAGARQLYKLIGSVEVLGNPVGLVSNVTDGVSDFVMAPLKGIQDSPQAFATGIAKGTTSLVSSAVSGVLGSTAGITGAMAKGLQAASGCKESNRRQGMIGAVRALGDGIASGITGIVVQPMQGVQQEGMAGLAKGVGKGLIGIVAKPVAGVLDMTSTTINSMKNIADVLRDVNTTSRVRPQRPIIAGVIQPYTVRWATGQVYASNLKSVDWGADEQLGDWFVHKNIWYFVTTHRVVCARRTSSTLFRSKGAWGKVIWTAKLNKMFKPKIHNAEITVVMEDSQEQKRSCFKSHINRVVRRIEAPDQDRAKRLHVLLGRQWVAAHTQISTQNINSKDTLDSSLWTGQGVKSTSKHVESSLLTENGDTTTEAEMLLDESAAVPHRAVSWVPADEVTCCMMCEAKFTLMKRKHHCRKCGKVMCAKCTRKRIPLPNQGFDNAVRVCDECVSARSNSRDSRQQSRQASRARGSATIPFSAS